MGVRVRLFGAEARIVGAGEVVLRVREGADVGELREALRQAFPGLQESLAHGRFAVAHDFATESRVIEAGDEVALIGLVSGG